MAQPERPLSPFMHYRWQYTNTLSILHRITGVLLSACFFLLVYWLAAAAAGPASYEGALRCLRSPSTQFVLFGGLSAFCYHLLNGVRHLFFDAGLRLRTAHRAQERMGRCDRRGGVRTAGMDGSQKPPGVLHEPAQSARPRARPGFGQGRLVALVCPARHGSGARAARPLVHRVAGLAREHGLGAVRRLAALAGEFRARGAVRRGRRLARQPRPAGRGRGLRLDARARASWCCWPSSSRSRSRPSSACCPCCASRSEPGHDRCVFVHRSHLRRRRGRRRRRRAARDVRPRGGGPQHGVHHQGVPDAQPHGGGAGRHQRRARQHGRGRLALPLLRHDQGLGLARRPGRDRVHVQRGAGRRSSSSSTTACRSRAPKTARSTSARSAA